MSRSCQKRQRESGAESAKEETNCFEQNMSSKDTRIQMMENCRL